MFRKFKYLLLLIVLIVQPLIMLATPVNSFKVAEDIYEAAFDNPFGNFLNYHIEGVCFWWHWSLLGPYVTATLKVNEFLPDAIVSVYTHYGDDPLWYTKVFVDPVMRAAGNATARGIDGSAPKSTRFSGGSGGGSLEQYKEVNIVGNPALAVFLSQIGFMMISTQATEFEPYYSSLADTYLWHSPMMEDLTHPEDLLPGIRTVGSFIDQWGPIFPRTGYVNQGGDYKAAAVLALRAADIATNADQAHVYNPLPSGSCGSHCKVWPSHENDFDNVKYQEIYPVLHTHAHRIFGVNDLVGTTYGQSQLSKGNGNYVWVMWRHYKGCIQGGGSFLGET